MLNDLLNQFPERIVGMLRVDVLNEFGNDFSVGFRFKLVSLVFQKLLDVLVVGNDSCWQIIKTSNRLPGNPLAKTETTVVNDNELVILVGTMRVRVDLVGDTVSGPASVRDTTVSLVNPFEIQYCFHC